MSHSFDLSVLSQQKVMDCRWSAPGISVMASVLWSHVPREIFMYIFSKLGVKNTIGTFLKMQYLN